MRDLSSKVPWLTQQDSLAAPGHWLEVKVANPTAGVSILLGSATDTPRTKSRLTPASTKPRNYKWFVHFFNKLKDPTSNTSRRMKIAFSRT